MPSAREPSAAFTAARHQYICVLHPPPASGNLLLLLLAFAQIMLSAAQQKHHAQQKHPAKASSSWSSALSREKSDKVLKSIDVARGGTSRFTGLF